MKTLQHSPVTAVDFHEWLFLRGNPNALGSELEYLGEHSFRCGCPICSDCEPLPARERFDEVAPGAFVYRGDLLDEGPDLPLQWVGALLCIVCAAGVLWLLGECVWCLLEVAK